MSRRRELAHDLLRRLEVRLHDRVLERAPATARVAAGVHVDHRQRLGVVDHQVAAVRQVDAPRERVAEHLVDARLLEQQVVALVQLDPLQQLRRGAREEARHAVMLLLVVDHRAVELARVDVPHDADRQVRLLEHHRRRARLLDPALEHLVQPQEVLHLTLHVALPRAVGGRADDQPALVELQARGELAQPLALLVGQLARHADALAVGRVHQVPPGDRDLHRQARALRADRVLGHLHDDLLPRLQQVGDARAAALPAAAAIRLPVGGDDLVDVEEAVLLEADVDEGGLHSGEHVVDPPLVDVADDRPPAAALDVELRDAPVLVDLRHALRPPLLLVLATGGLLAFEYRDPRLTAVDGYQYLLSHQISFETSGGPAAPKSVPPVGAHTARTAASRAHASASDLEAAASRACTYTLWSSPRAIKVTITDEPP